MLFRCFIRGENFPGELIGENGLYGFYTTRWVEAESVGDAEVHALELLKVDPTFEIRSEKLRERAKGAKVHFEKIEAVSATKQKRVNCGATWFEMG